MIRNKNDAYLESCSHESEGYSGEASKHTVKISFA